MLDRGPVWPAIEIEPVAAVDVQVLGHRRSEMGDVGVVDRESGCPEPRYGCADQFGVERGDAVHHQREAQGLSGLVPELAVPDVTVVAEEDRVPQALDVLALVQLAADPQSEAES